MSPETASATPRRSCLWLEAGLGFSPWGLHCCPVTHHGDRGWAPIAPYAGGPLPAEAIVQARERFRQGLASGRSEDAAPECRNCALVTEQVWPEKRFLIDVINVCQSTVCNVACAYCYLHRETPGSRWWNDPECIKAGKTPYDVFPVLREAVASGLMSPETTVNWAGGEPTILPDFEAMLSWCTEQGMWHYLATNGVRFSPAAMAALEAHHLSVVASVDCGTRETYARMKKRDAFEQVWTNLARYAAHGRNVEAKYILTHDNLSGGDTLGFVRRAAEVGVPQIVMDVDAFEAHIPETFITAMAAMRREAERLGLSAITAGCGVASFPENEVPRRAGEMLCGASATVSKGAKGLLGRFLDRLRGRENRPPAPPEPGGDKTRRMG